MDIKVTPQKLCGKINVPPSKSVSHRALICASLAKGNSTVYNLLDCEDTRATIDALNALGAEIKFENGTAYIKGISEPNKKAVINCRESGSTLRFMMPVAAVLGADTVFEGYGKLPERPVTPFITEFPKHNVTFVKDTMPYEINGSLNAGDYYVSGDISSQFITGYMLALPLTNEKCSIKLTSQLQSRPYAELTADVMESFGIKTEILENSFELSGNDTFTAREYTVEADMSQAAFFLVGKAIGGDIEPLGLRTDSKQGDRAIIDIVNEFIGNGGKAFDVNAENIPDLVPILTVLACFADGTSHITGCARLRIKECDRLAAITEELNKLGADITEGEDYLTINGVKELHGGDCSAHNDHRIAMSLAIASQRCTEPVIIRGAQCVSKSYPEFFKDFAKIGGKTDVI